MEPGAWPAPSHGVAPLVPRTWTQPPTRSPPQTRCESGQETPTRVLYVDLAECQKGSVDAWPPAAVGDRGLGLGYPALDPHAEPKVLARVLYVDAPENPMVSGTYRLLAAQQHGRPAWGDGAKHVYFRDHRWTIGPADGRPWAMALDPAESPDLVRTWASAVDLKKTTVPLEALAWRQTTVVGCACQSWCKHICKATLATLPKKTAEWDAAYARKYRHHVTPYENLNPERPFGGLRDRGPATPVPPRTVSRASVGGRSGYPAPLEAPQAGQRSYGLSWRHGGCSF